MMTDLANPSFSSRRRLLNRAGDQRRVSNCFSGGEVPASLIRYFLRLLLQGRNSQVHNMPGGSLGPLFPAHFRLSRIHCVFGGIQSSAMAMPRSVTYA
jgi:hypothetical protein